MEQIISTFGTMFNIEYTFVNMICVYCVIKSMTTINYAVLNKSWIKKVATLATSIVTGLIFVLCFDDSAKVIISSAMLTIVAYDYMIKRFLELLKIK